jgi:uroporphyrin-III C-methyltransferase / precorrin-2 dehydrogenase / sirohydrochlorin ferrochelatase
MDETFLPLGLRVSGRLCVVVGAGNVAYRKAQSLLQAGASVQVIAPVFQPSLEHWERLGATLTQNHYDGFCDLGQPFLVVAATNDSTVNAQVARDARVMGALVLRADDPADSDFSFPATLRRGHLTVSFATDGLAPSFSRFLRQLTEQEYDEGDAALVEVLSRVGQHPAFRAMSSSEKRDFLGDERMTALRRRVNNDTKEATFQALLEELSHHAPLGTKAPRVGRVSLVGAGPGDPELLTLKGAQRLQEADVVVHDALLSADIMDRHASYAQRIDVGKRKGQTYLRQEEINALLVRLAQEGYRVVRLKGGDPCLFGRAEEERRALLSAGVPCEIVSGVSTLSAVPAAAGMVVTNRVDARSLGAFSLHKRDGARPSDAEWERMAKGPDTLILFMGRTILREACERLIHWGRLPHTPAALIINGTLPGQRVVRGTLATLPDKAATATLEGPGLIVVGTVAEPDGALHQAQ